MQPSVSKLTKKYQATIPANIRKKLSLNAGDTITFEQQNGQVIIRKSTPMDLEFAAAASETLNEWSSGADDEAYHDL